MAERPITFAKVSDGVWMNRETGVRIWSRGPASNRVYVLNVPSMGEVHDGVRWPLGNGGWKTPYADPFATRKMAVEAGKRQAEAIREQIAAAYDDALTQHIDFTEVRMNAVGLGQKLAWRIASARRQIDKVARGDAHGHDAAYWLKMAVGDLTYVNVRVDAKLGTIARVSPPEVLHFDPSFGEPIACGDADPWIKRTEMRRLVTCPDCKTELDARDFDRVIEPLCADQRDDLMQRLAQAGFRRGQREATVLALDFVADVLVAERECTKPYGWSEPHAFEHDPGEVAEAEAGNGGIDPYERCGKTSAYDVHQVPSMGETGGGKTDPVAALRANVQSHVQFGTADQLDIPREMLQMPGLVEVSNTAPTRADQPNHFGDDYLLPVCRSRAETQAGPSTQVTFTVDQTDCVACLRVLAGRWIATQVEVESRGE